MRRVADAAIGRGASRVRKTPVAGFYAESPIKRARRNMACACE